MCDTVLERRPLSSSRQRRIRDRRRTAVWAVRKAHIDRMALVKNLAGLGILTCTSSNRRQDEDVGFLKTGDCNVYRHDDPFSGNSIFEQYGVADGNDWCDNGVLVLGNSDAWRSPVTIYISNCLPDIDPHVVTDSACLDLVVKDDVALQSRQDCASQTDTPPSKYYSTNRKISLPWFRRKAKFDFNPNAFPFVPSLVVAPAVPFFPANEPPVDELVNSAMDGAVDNKTFDLRCPCWSSSFISCKHCEPYKKSGSLASPADNLAASVVGGMSITTASANGSTPLPPVSPTDGGQATTIAHAIRSTPLPADGTTPFPAIELLTNGLAPSLADGESTAANANGWSTSLGHRLFFNFRLLEVHMIPRKGDHVSIHSSALRPYRKTIVLQRVGKTGKLVDVIRDYDAGDGDQAVVRMEGEQYENENSGGAVFFLDELHVISPALGVEENKDLDELLAALAMDGASTTALANGSTPWPADGTTSLPADADSSSLANITEECVPDNVVRAAKAKFRRSYSRMRWESVDGKWICILDDEEDEIHDRWVYIQGMFCLQDPSSGGDCGSDD